MNQDASDLSSRAFFVYKQLSARRTAVFAVLFVVLAAAAVVVGRDPLIPVVLLMLGTVAALPPALGETPPYAFNLPGVPDGPPPASRIPVNVYSIVTASVGVASVMLLALDLPSQAFIVLALVALVAWSAAADSVFRRLRYTRRLRRALKAYAPEIAMAYAGRSGGSWQLMMWEPYLLRSGLRCVIINRNESHVGVIRDGADIASPFIQLGSNSKRDVGALLVPSLKTFYYVQNARNNNDFMRQSRITHVWLNHGDSDKPANFNPRHAKYDKLVVCGQAGIDRYERHGIHVDAHKFEIVGRPQAREIQTVTGPIADVANPKVLYAPTWQGVDASVNFSSLDKGPEIVRQLIARGATVVFRPHPLSSRWQGRRNVIADIISILKEDQEATGRTHYFGKHVTVRRSVADCANLCDAMISDVSSVVSDFLQSEKPYAMMSMRASVEEFRKEFAVAETGYVILGDLSNLGDVLDDMLGPDPLAPERRQRKRYVLGEFVGEESAEAFADLVRRLAHGHV